MKKLVIIFIAVLSFHLSFAQDVDFNVSAPRVVSVGERFQITYRLNAKGSEIEFPDFGEISVQGPSTQTSSSVEIINGRMKQSYSYAYVFYAMANKAGKFTLSPAVVKVKGKKIASNSLTIEVVGESTPQNAVESSTNKNLPQKDVFASISLSKSSAYIGEGILATLKFYTRINLVDVNDLNLPSFAGFWTQDVFSPTQISMERENVNGTIYNAAIVKKVLLFPQKTGKISLEPFKLTVVKGRPSFFGMQAAGELKLVSNKPTIKVKSLPSSQPKEFSGAVGVFSIKSKIDNQKVKANDAIKIDIRVSGTGNLKLLSAPKVEFPPQFESFEPKVSETIKSTTAGQSGTKVFQYLLIPRKAGNYEIEGIKFSYFDLSSKSYKTIKTKNFKVEVEPSEGQETTIMNNQSVLKSEIEVLNSDILFIKENAPEFHKKDAYFMGTKNYYLLLSIPFLLFLITIILLRKRAKEMADAAKMRTKKAGKISRKRLKLAKKYIHSENSEMFFSSINDALTGYVADKLNISLSDLKMDVLKEKLKQKGIEQEIISKYFDLLERSEYARFAPSAENEDFNTIYKEASKLIDAIDKKL